MKKLFLIFAFIFCACGKGQTITSPADTMDKFEKFKQKEKFTEDLQMHYPGTGDVKMRPVLSKKINQAADDFKEVAKSPDPTDKKYQEKIKTGLDRFSDIYPNLDTEDRERICSYFEELMDIVGLESSDGLLMGFMYK